MYDDNVPALSIVRKTQNYVINVAGHLPACCEIQIINEFRVVVSVLSQTGFSEIAEGNLSIWGINQSGRRYLGACRAGPAVLFSQKKKKKSLGTFREIGYEGKKHCKSHSPFTNIIHTHSIMKDQHRGCRAQHTGRKYLPHHLRPSVSIAGKEGIHKNCEVALSLWTPEAAW